MDTKEKEKHDIKDNLQSEFRSLLGYCKLDQVLKCFDWFTIESLTIKSLNPRLRRQNKSTVYLLRINPWGT